MKNMGIIDRIIRLVLAVAIAVLYFAGAISGTAAIVLGIIGIVLLVTSVSAVCPAYFPFKIKTIKNTSGTSSTTK